VLESADGAARLMVYVEENDAHQSPASFVRSNLTTPIAQIDYRRITDRFFAVSGENEVGFSTVAATFLTQEMAPCIVSSCPTRAERRKRGTIS
jgi:hypothetical protein